jgi:hypothetical protein
VDRLGGMLARRIALDHARRHGEAALVRIDYVPGGERPRAVTVRAGAGAGAGEFAVDPSSEVADWPLDNASVARGCTVRPPVATPELARWGHHGVQRVRWERFG